MSRQRPLPVPMGGGLDYTTPLTFSKKGRVLGGSNYEANTRGYRRIGGYEPYDGTVFAHNQSYYILDFDNGSTEVSQGDTVEGATSGHTAIAAIDAVLESGSYGAGDAAGYLVLTKNTTNFPSFTNGEDLEVSAAKVAEAASTSSLRGADTEALDQTYMSDVAKYWMSTQSGPTGSGGINGVHFYSDGNIDNTNYASAICFRNNSGGTAGQMFDISTSGSGGWQAVTLYKTLSFDNNTTGTFTVDKTLTGATSGASGVIMAVVRQSGTWGTDAAGYLVLRSVAGTFLNNETINAPGVAARADGTVADITLPAGGRYRCINTNVQATTDLRKMYFANGVGYAHQVEWYLPDTLVLVTPIKIPGLDASEDKPTHVAEFKNHLFLAYANGVIRVSSIGNPTEFIAATGASEHGFGDQPTGFMVSSGVLVVFGRKRISYFTGSSSADWNLVPLSSENGANADTMQLVDVPYYYDGQRIRKLMQTDALGGFSFSSLCPEIEPLLELKREFGITPVTSYRIQGRDQYVILFSDFTGLSIYLGRRKPEPMLITLGFGVTCSVEIDHTEPFGGLNRDTVLVGSDDGEVYLMDVGRSFAGESISSYLAMAPIYPGGEFQNHRFHKMRVSIIPDDLILTDEPIAMTCAPLYSAGTDATPYQLFTIVENELNSPSGFALDASFTTIAGKKATREFDMDGFGFNILPIFLTTSDVELPHIIDLFTIFTTQRGQNG